MGRNPRGGLAVPPSLAEYRSHRDGSRPAWAEALGEALADDPAAFRAALSPGRLPAGRIPDAAGSREHEEGPEGKEDGETPPTAGGALARAEANLMLRHLKRGRGALTPGVLEAASGFDLARDLLADSVVERARVLAGFDDPADAFSRRGRPRAGAEGEGVVPPWEVAPKLAGGGTQGAPFVFVARDPATLWRAALALAGAGVDGGEVAADEGLAPGAAHPEAVCAGIGGSRKPGSAGKGEEARLGAAALPHLLASVVRGLEAPFRARGAQAAQGSPEADRPGLLAHHVAGARSAEKFPGQRRWDLARKDLAAAEERLRQALAGVKLLEEALLARPALVGAAARATDGEERAREEARRRKALEARARRTLGRADEELYVANAELESQRRARPGLLSRLLLPSRERRWLAEGRRLEERYDARLARAEGAAAALAEAEKDHEDARLVLSDAVRVERSARKKLNQAKRRIEQGISELGPAAPDPDLYAEDEGGRRRALDRAWDSPEGTQYAAPYVSGKVRDAAEEVLARALSLHRVFALVAARPVAENLRALLALAEDPRRGIAGAPSIGGGEGAAPSGRSASSGPGPSGKTGPGARDLLASLSLVAPATGLVLGSAMGEALLGSLRREAVGWLLVFGEPEGAGSGEGAPDPDPLEDALFRARRAAFLDPA